MMDFHFPPLHQPFYNVENAYFIAGRMLALCQNFEMSCKHALSSVFAMEKINNTVFTLEDYGKEYDKNINMFLGTLKSLAKKNKYIDDDAIYSIEQAIKARNYICHELLLEVIGASQAGYVDFLMEKKGYSNEDALIEMLENEEKNINTVEYKFKVDIFKYVRDIGLGDFYVSRISYQITEKEPYPISKSNHINIIESFIRDSYSYEVRPILSLDHNDNERFRE